MAVHTVYVVVVVLFGWFFFLAFCLVAMWYFLTRKKKMKEKMMQEADIICHDKHGRVKEDVVKGPMGAETIALSIEKDERFEEDIIKNEKELKGKNMHWKNGDVDLEKEVSSASAFYA